MYDVAREKRIDRRKISPLDLLMLSETYGDRTIKELRDRYQSETALQFNAQLAIHHAVSFTEWDDSFFRGWSEAEQVAWVEERSR
jgi:hypothetical protein